MKTAFLPFLAAAALLASSAAAQAAGTTVTVAGQADLYDAVTPGTYDGLNPIAINVTGLSALTFSVSSLAGASGNGVSVNIGSGSDFSNADGSAHSGENVFAAGSLSGISAPTSGFLAGVFTGAATVATPATINFNTSGTSFASLSAGLQQTFYIGDGLTGNGTGATQTFYVPTGATTLYLGVTDACGFNGGPGCYGDNTGGYSVTTQTVSAVPEPATWALLLSGLLVIGFTRRNTVAHAFAGFKQATLRKPRHA